MPDKLARMQVELDVESEGLSQGLDQASAELDQFESNLAELNTQSLDALLSNLEAQFTAMEADLAKLDARIEATQSKMAAAGTLPSTINEDPGILKMQQNAMGLQASLDLVKAKIDKVKTAVATIKAQPINKIKDAFQQVGQKAEEAGEKSDRSIKKSMKTILKAGALLMGLRTIYSLITKSVQAYLGQNDALQTRINSMYVALGSLLAPAIETVVRWMTQFVQWVIVASAYTAKFLNAVFGLNLAIKTSATNAGALNKNLKQTSKQLSNLAGFDDLTILQDPASASAATPETGQVDLKPFDMTSALTGLDAFGQKMEELTPILQPVLTILGLIGFALVAILSPMAGVALAVGLLIGLVALVVAKWDQMNGVQKGLIIGLGLITAGILGWIAVQSIINALMFANPIGLIVLGIAALVGVIALVIIYWKELGQVIGSVANTIYKALSGAFESVKKVVGGVWDWIMKLFNSGGKIFNGVVEGVSSIFKTIVNGLISGINVLIAAPFKAINGLLNTIRATSILGIKPFTGMWGVNPLPVPQIPKLASGAIATGPTFAEIGEGKFDEAVIPLGQSPQFIKMKQDIADAVNRNGAGNQPMEVYMIVDGDTFARVSVKNINRLQRQTGKVLLKT